MIILRKSKKWNW